MGRVDLTDRRANVPMAVWRDQPGMLGVRVTFTRGPATAWITDGTADWLWREAERAGVPIMIHAPGQSAAIRLIAERHPELKLTIDHVGLTSRTLEHEIDDAIASVVALADCDNIAVKATALPVVVSDAYPFASLSGRISKIFDAFGPHRMFWGSDLSRLPEPRCTYRQAVNHFTEELDFLTREDLTWIMGAGVEAWLGWDVPHRQVTRPGGESGGRP